MSRQWHYSTAARERDPRALPDIEVFSADALNSDGIGGEPYEPGWYWWSCFPGCLPDGEPNGPFDTADAALEDAWEQRADDEEGAE